MSKVTKKGISWEDAIQEAGELPKGHSKKPFAERA